MARASLTKFSGVLAGIGLLGLGYSFTQPGELIFWRYVFGAISSVSMLLLIKATIREKKESYSRKWSFMFPVITLAWLGVQLVDIGVLKESTPFALIMFGLVSWGVGEWIDYTVASRKKKTMKIKFSLLFPIVILLSQFFISRPPTLIIVDTLFAGMVGFIADEVS